jgi:hypothetical protein
MASVCQKKKSKMASERLKREIKFWMCGQRNND